jgi:hypothetical protein
MRSESFTGSLVWACIGNVKKVHAPEHKIKKKRYFKLNLLTTCSIVMAGKFN